MGLIMYKDVAYGDNAPELLAPTPFTCSEDEEQVGIWVDGKPLYQKTFVPTTAVTIQAGTGWYTTGITIPNLETIVTTHALTSNHACVDGWLNFLNYNDSGEIYASHSRSTAVSFSYFTIQYTKTTDTAWRGGFKSYGFNPIIYSLEEREVGVWTNGKPLYQKTIYDAGGVADDPYSINHGISNLEAVVGYTGCVSDNGRLPIPIPRIGNDGMLVGIATVTSTIVKVANPYNTRLIWWYITLYYTKTTDTAGSGKYTSLGIPAVHYSSDEQIIGTWINGSTIYQKTFDFGSNVACASGAWTSVENTAIANWNSFVNAFGTDAAGTVFNCINVNYSNNKIGIQNTRSSSLNIRYLTVQYTKSS